MDYAIYHLGHRLGNLQRIGTHKRLPSAAQYGSFFKDVFQGDVPPHIQAKITLSNKLPYLLMEPARDTPRVEEARHARDTLTSIGTRILEKAHNTTERAIEEIVRQWNKTPHRQPLLVGVSEDDDTDPHHPALLIVACSESKRFLYARDGIFCGSSLGEAVKRYAKSMSDQYHTPFSVYRGKRNKI